MNTILQIFQLMTPLDRFMSCLGMLVVVLYVWGLSASLFGWIYRRWNLPTDQAKFYAKCQSEDQDAWQDTNA